MKKFLLAMLQFVLFYLVFLVGSFVPPFHLRRVLSVTSEGTRLFYMDGLLLMVVLFVVILLVEAARKRIASAGPWTVAAFLLALVAGLASKLGFMTIPR